MGHCHILPFICSLNSLQVNTNTSVQHQFNIFTLRNKIQEERHQHQEYRNKGSCMLKGEVITETIDKNSF